MSYLGDFASGVTFDRQFCTVNTSGAPTTLAGGAISVYKDNGTTETTTGVTLTTDFDGRTGLHNVRVVLTDAFYAGGANYHVVITAGTVGGTSVVGYVIAEFSINNRSQGAGVIRRFTAQAGGAQTITLDASATAVHGRPGNIIRTIAGTGIDQEGTIASYDNGTKIATMDNPWVTAPDATTVADIFAASQAATVDAIGDDIQARNLTVGTMQPNTILGGTLDPSAGEEIADALLGRNVAGGSNTGRLVKEAFYGMRNKWTIVGTTLTVYQTDDVTPAFTATVTTAPSDPVTSADPA